MNKRGNGLLLAFLAGATVGAVLGILYAPDKGSNTREKLSLRLNKYKKTLEDFIRGMVAEKNAPASEGSPAQPHTQKVVTEAQEKAERLLEDVDALLAQLRGNKS